MVDINSGCDVSIHTCHGNWLNKSNLALYKLLLHYYNHLNSCSKVIRYSASVTKVGVVDADVCVSSHLKEELA